MSVPLSKRGKGTLSVFPKLRQLCIYTQSIVENRKYFPIERTKILDNGKETYNVVKPVLAMEIYSSTLAVENYAKRANKVFVKTQEDFNLRREFWNKAVAETSALTGLIEKAMVTCNLPSKTVNFWVGQIKEIQDLLMDRRSAEYKI